jgi:hypothetical protein
MMLTVSKLEQLLGRVFDSAREGLREILDPQEYEKRRHDFIFHMADWKDDLERLADLYNHPERRDEDAASTLVIGFLYHVIPHLNAAGRLLLDEIGDPFSQSENPPSQ